MIVLDCEQGSGTWLRARCGVFTASEATNLITIAGNITKSEARNEYVAGKLAERMTGEPNVDLSGFNLEPVERGHDLEPQAMGWWGFNTDLVPERPGFVFKDETKRAGCSPDWLVLREGGDEFVGGVECKIPENKRQLLNMASVLQGRVPRQYVPQIQWSLWVTGLQWWEFFSFTDHPRLRPVRLRVGPDPDWQKRIGQAVERAVTDMDDMAHVFEDAGIQTSSPEQ